MSMVDLDQGLEANRGFSHFASQVAGQGHRQFGELQQIHAKVSLTLCRPAGCCDTSAVALGLLQRLLAKPVTSRPVHPVATPIHAVHTARAHLCLHGLASVFAPDEPNCKPQSSGTAFGGTEDRHAGLAGAEA
jgi:hypothetical protein